MTRMMGLNKCRGRLVALSCVALGVLYLFLATDTGLVRWLPSQDPVHVLAEKILQRLESGGPLIVLNITNVINGSPQNTQINVTPKIAPETKRELEHFMPVMNKQEKGALFSALVKLAQAATLHNFTYMMYSGTLVGSYRHHDMVPWDDDLDIFMDYTERKQIVSVLEQYAPEYVVRSAGARVKFYAAEGTQTSKYPWKWPYIDISFFKQNATHIWDGSMEDDYGDRYYLYRKQIVFPLHDRPMGQYFFKAPRDSYAHIKRTYGPGTFDLCTTSHYSHKNEALTDKIHKIPCESLAKIYPFVHRSPVKGGVKETLIFDGKIIHSMDVPEPEYAVTKPYRLDLV